MGGGGGNDSAIVRRRYAGFFENDPDLRLRLSRFQFRAGVITQPEEYGIRYFVALPSGACRPEKCHLGIDG